MVMEQANLLLQRRYCGERGRGVCILLASRPSVPLTQHCKQSTPYIDGQRIAFDVVSLPEQCTQMTLNVLGNVQAGKITAPLCIASRLTELALRGRNAPAVLFALLLILSAGEHTLLFGD